MFWKCSEVCKSLVLLLVFVINCRLKVGTLLDNSWRERKREKWRQLWCLTTFLMWEITKNMAFLSKEIIIIPMEQCARTLMITIAMFFCSWISQYKFIEKNIHTSINVLHDGVWVVCINCWSAVHWMQDIPMKPQKPSNREPLRVSEEDNFYVIKNTNSHSIASIFIFHGSVH